MCSGSSLYSLKYSSEVAIVYASLRLTFGPCQQQQRSLYWRVHVPGWAANSSPSVARSLSRHTDWVRQRINWEKTTRTATCEAEELTDWGSAASSRHWVDLFIFYISLSIQYYIWDKTASKKKNTVYIYIYYTVYVCMGEIRCHGNLPSVSWKGEEMLGKERSIVPFRAPLYSL